MQQLYEYLIVSVLRHHILSILYNSITSVVLNHIRNKRQII